MSNKNSVYTPIMGLDYVLGINIQKRVLLQMYITRFIKLILNT